MSTPSILSAIRKIRFLLTRREKITCLGIAAFAACVSLLEVLTASVIVVFAQVLIQPDVGQTYMTKLGIKAAFPPERIICYIALSVGIIYFLKNIVSAFEIMYQNFSIQKMSYHFKNKLLNRYADADYGLYLTRNSALGATTVGGDSELMFLRGMVPLAVLLSEGTIFFSLIFFIIYSQPFLAFIIFGIGLLMGLFLTKGLFPLFYRWGKHLQEASLYGSQNLSQFFHAFKEIVLLGKKEAFIKAYQEHSYKRARMVALQTTTNAFPRMLIEVLFVGLFVFTITFLCAQHKSAIHMMGILGGYLYVGFRLMPGLNRMITQLNDFKGAIPSIDRVYVEYTTLANTENYVDCPEFVFEEGIHLGDVSFKYPNAHQNALKKASIVIQKGECIGVVGETGSGKSTLVDVILGLLRPQQGAICIDGKYAVNSFQWHQKIGYVPQSVYLTDNTIEANIAFGEQVIDDVKLNAAIDAAQLRHFVDQLPEGSKTFVGERGIRLSGGERQRISIARALYRNPEVLIFDEATSALDNETEARLMETIHAVSHNRTVIMVAHRLTTLKDCDRIVRMEKGKIAGIVTYEELDVGSVHKEKKVI